MLRNLAVSYSNFIGSLVSVRRGKYFIVALIAIISIIILYFALLLIALLLGNVITWITGDVSVENSIEPVFIYAFILGCISNNIFVFTAYLVKIIGDKFL